MAKSQQGLTTKTATKMSRIRKFGFMTRMLRNGGQNVIKRRRAKGRVRLSASNEFGSKMEKNKKFSRRR